MHSKKLMSSTELLAPLGMEKIFQRLLSLFMSTNAASALLVTTLNEGRDVILDGTMSWEPFVLQTIAMARDVHTKNYRMGPGYGQLSDGTTFEKYWEPAEDCDEIEATDGSVVPANAGEQGETKPLPRAEKKPYRIEFVGVVCDAHMAVVRGMRRAILTKRGVPVRGQLRSHKLFTSAIKKYSELMDHVKICSTSAMGGPAELIAYKDGAHKLLKDCEEFSVLKDLTRLNIDAKSVLELYGCGPEAKTTQKWCDIVLAPDRLTRQELLTLTLSNAHLHHALSESDLGFLGNCSSSPQGGFPSSLSTFRSLGDNNPGSGLNGAGGSTGDS